jgi:hypothetical protein
MSLTGITATTLKLVTGGTTYTQELGLAFFTSWRNSVKITNPAVARVFGPLVLMKTTGTAVITATLSDDTAYDTISVS